ENILLDSNDNPNPNVVIADFGFASQSIRNDSNLLATSCGSPAYAAPELVLKDKYVGVSSDIWSCGVILYAMLCGYLPFDDDPTNPDGANIHLLYKYIMSAMPDYPSRLTEDAQDLIGIMLVTDPDLRAKMSDIMGHRWLAPAVFVFEEELVRRKKLLGIVDSNETMTETAPSPVPETSDTVPPSVVSETDSREADNHSVVTAPPTFSIIPQAPQPAPARLLALSKSDAHLKTTTTTDSDASPPLSPPELFTTPSKRVDWAVKEDDTPPQSSNSPPRQDSPLDTGASTPTRLESASATGVPTYDSKPVDLARSRSNKTRPFRQAPLAASSAGTPEDAMSRTTSVRPSLAGGVSISASDYHLRFSKHRPTRKLRMHTGPIDKRALSPRDPEFLLADLEMALLDAGLEVDAAKGLALGEYRLVVKQPGVVMNGVPGAKRRRGIPVDLKQLVKSGNVSSDAVVALERKIGEAETVVLEPTVAKAMHKAVKGKGSSTISGGSGRGFPVWIIRKIQYLASFGFNYNRGYDGRSTGHGSSSDAVESSPTIPSSSESTLFYVDEITFNVEIFKLKNLDGMYVVAFKRVRGDIWEFKHLYDKLIADLPLEKEY
ncbi:kinase-like domain-containing protein, partial [Chytriomyces sp. MP71]